MSCKFPLFSSLQKLGIVLFVSLFHYCGVLWVLLSRLAIAINVHKKRAELQMVIVHKPLGVRRWVSSFWKLHKMWSKIEQSYVSFNEEMFVI